jgi:Xaa-Pro aminopeptidase
MTEQVEIERRLAAVREAAQANDVDAVVVSGSEYTGFEGAVRYLSCFRILHRYAYVVVPVEGDPAIVYPREARWVGDHWETLLAEQVFAEHPGRWIAEQAREQHWRRIGVYGLDHVMAVRDYRALADGQAVIVPFDEQFDLARAVKSEQELESVRQSMRINEAGVEAVLRAYGPGKTEAELMGEAERVFTAAGCYRTTMDMILGGPDGAAYPEFKFPSAERAIAPGDLLLYGLEVAGPGGHWVEFSRPICAAPRGEIALDTLKAMEAYHEYYEAAKKTMKAGATAHDVHTAVSKGFHDRGFQLGHVTGHSIGMTMIEHPRIGEGNETTLRENMVVSMHPHAITQDERACLYMQDTWLVTADGGVPFSNVPLGIYDGSEDRL